MTRFSYLSVLGFLAISVGYVAADIELPELDYEWYELEPYISEEVSYRCALALVQKHFRSDRGS